MNDHEPGAERTWERGWEGHVRAQRQRLAMLPLADKLRWLEEAQETAERLRRSTPHGAGRVAEPAPGKDPADGA